MKEPLSIVRVPTRLRARQAVRPNLSTEAAMRRALGRVVLVGMLIPVLPAPVEAQPRTTTRVSVATGGGQADSRSADARLSADGRFVAFYSTATNLVAGDTNGVWDVFVHDRQPGTTTRVSVATGGGQANGGSYGGTLSADGRFVAFSSAATNLVAGDTNDVWDVFVHDRQAGTTTRVSVASGGGEANGRSEGPFTPLSADGRYVAFASDASNLVMGDTNGVSDIFVHDRQTATTTRVSVATGGGQANDDTGEEGWASPGSFGPALSADGRFVAFYSLATNLVAGDTNGVRDVFVHDRQAGTTTRVSVASGGGEANGGSYAPSVNADGRHVAFISAATNLVADDTNGEPDVFVHDRQTAATTRVSVAKARCPTPTCTPCTGVEQANNRSAWPALSADGRYVAFSSTAINLVPGDSNFADDVFVHDRQTGTTIRVSVAIGGGQTSPYGAHNLKPSISADGRQVAFTSGASDLVPGDTNRQEDVFVSAPRAVAADHDGDGVSDLVVFRPSSGTWYVVESSTGTPAAVLWGATGDVPVEGDYDGDAKADPAVYRPATGTWFVLQTSTGTGVAQTWGVSDDIPVPADYDGDGTTDVAVYRPSTGVWYIVQSRAKIAVGLRLPGEQTGDVPVPGDYDGDGQADPTLFRPATGEWYEWRSATGTVFRMVWGAPGDVPLAGDYNGDGQADPTLFRPATGEWYEWRSGIGAVGLAWGEDGDVPIVGDYDGDGRMDPTVFRPSMGVWYQWRSVTSPSAPAGCVIGFLWGAPADLPR